MIRIHSETVVDLFLNIWKKYPECRRDLLRILETWGHNVDVFIRHHPWFFHIGEQWVDGVFRGLYTHLGPLPVTNPFVLRRLHTSTKEQRAKFLDAKFAHKRRQWCKQHSKKTLFTRGWYGPELPVPPPPVHVVKALGPRNGRVTKKPSVPARDHDTGRCAVSGDKLECRWDDDKEQWVYEFGARLANGDLVHMHAL